MSRPVRIAGVRPQPGYVVEVTFTDGTNRQIDLEQYLRGPIFEPVREPSYFQQVTVDTRAGTIVWPNGADIDPDVLYHGLDPAGEPTDDPSAVDSIS